MNNVKTVTDAGLCVGCGDCKGCVHITFQRNALGFPAPVVDEGCTHCGECLKKCIYWDDGND
ncbi:MAG: hypothetical protein J6D21_10775 [Clostridia bacterium]|nr:hypothetical protein [Clostridia bacterium]